MNHTNRIRTAFGVDADEARETIVRLENLKPIVEFFPVEVRFAGRTYVFENVPEIFDFQTELKAILNTAKESQ